MPRKARRSVGGIVYHVLNRGCGKMKLFSRDGDYLDYFVKIKQGEVQAAHEQITAWELERYLQLF